MSSREGIQAILGNKCDLCNSTESLEIHHKDRRPHNNELPNLQLLCKNCHRYKTHGWEKKKNQRTLNESHKGFAGTVKVQPRSAGGFHVTVPISAARKLGLKHKEMVEVFVDFEEKEFIYKFKKSTSTSRLKTLKKLGNMCEFCSSTEHMEIHHKDRNRENKEIVNLQLLCRSCHRNIHTKLHWDGKNPRLALIGNSVRMTIPMHLLRALNWKAGDIVEVGVENGSMIVTKIVD